MSKNTDSGEISAFFGETLLRWYGTNKRDLPWKQTLDPYAIWLSEVILQQTRVAQGMPYYQKFIQHFPTVEDLAIATDELVMQLWQGLGYYSRARSLHNTAKVIAKEHGGKFPTTMLELGRLKGIGPYTSAAIAAFAFNEQVVAVDGNLYRVISRFLADETDIASPKAQKHFFQQAFELMPKGSARVFNQAIMDFGSTVCTPKNPSCGTCVLAPKCQALLLKKVEQLPVKTNKLKRKTKYFHYLVLKSPEGYFMKRRPAKGIWPLLYDFPLFENDSADLLSKEELRESFNLNFIEKFFYPHPGVRHILTHLDLIIAFYFYETDNHADAQKWASEWGGLQVLAQPWETSAMPVPVATFFRSFNL